MIITASDVPDTSLVTDFTAFCHGCSSITSFPLIDTSSGLYFSWAWRSCSSLTSFPLIDTSSGLFFQSTWSDCTGLDGYDFPTINMGSMTDGASCFSGVTLSTTSYSDLLISIENLNINTGIDFHGGNSKYNVAGGVARTVLTSRVPAWTITDGGAA